MEWTRPTQGSAGMAPAQPWSLKSPPVTQHTGLDPVIKWEGNNEFGQYGKEMGRINGFFYSLCEEKGKYTGCLKKKGD